MTVPSEDEARGILPLVFIGPMGSGKTRIGSRVAKILGAPFVDTDKRIVADHGPIPEIFVSQGEPRFRAIERDVVARALTETAVISLGGGAILDTETQRDLASHRVVLLTVSADAVARRVNTDKRPLLKDGGDAWQRIYDERREIYERLASVSFDTTHEPAMKVAEAIAAWATAGTAEETVEETVDKTAEETIAEPPYETPKQDES